MADIDLEQLEQWLEREIIGLAEEIVKSIKSDNDENNKESNDNPPSNSPSNPSNNPPSNLSNNPPNTAQVHQLIMQSIFKAGQQNSTTTFLNNVNTAYKTVQKLAQFIVDKIALHKPPFEGTNNRIEQWFDEVKEYAEQSKANMLTLKNDLQKLINNLGNPNPNVSPSMTAIPVKKATPIILKPDYQFNVNNTASLNCQHNLEVFNRAMTDIADAINDISAILDAHITAYNKFGTLFNVSITSSKGQIQGTTMMDPLLCKDYPNYYTSKKPNPTITSNDLTDLVKAAAFVGEIENIILSAEKYDLGISKIIQIKETSSNPDTTLINQLYVVKSLISSPLGVCKKYDAIMNKGSGNPEIAYIWIIAPDVMKLSKSYYGLLKEALIGIYKAVTGHLGIKNAPDPNNLTLGQIANLITRGLANLSYLELNSCFNITNEKLSAGTKYIDKAVDLLIKYKIASPEEVVMHFILKLA